MAKKRYLVSQFLIRYARTLYELGEEAKNLPALRKDVTALLKTIESQESLADALENPGVPRNEKSALMAEVTKKLKSVKTLAQFVGVVMENNRAESLASILNAFQEYDADQQGIMTATVTSAQPLTAGQKKALIKTLSDKTGKSIDLDAEVDSDLIAGIIVNLGSTLYDASLKTKLEELHTSLKQPQEA